MKRQALGFLATALAVAVVVAMAGCVSTGGSQVVQDPRGRYSYEVSPDLSPQATDGTYDHYTLASPPMQVYVVAADATSEQAGQAVAFQRIGRDFASLKHAGTTSFGPWRAVAYNAVAEGEWAGLAYQYRGGTLYGIVVYGGTDSTSDSLPAAVMNIIASFEFDKAAGEVFRPATFAQLESFIDGTAASFGASISVAAVKDGRVVYRYAAGDRGLGAPASPDVAYHWGSISKIATATAVMQQVEQGRIDLDATLDAWFPEFPLGRRITVRNLLTHSAGLPSFEDTHLVAFGGDRLPDMAALLDGYWPRVRELAFEPGSLSAYNNWNFLILARLVEKASGEEFTRYVRRRVFAPAGMTGAAYTTTGLAGAPEALAMATPERLAMAESTLAGQGVSTAGLLVNQAGGRAQFRPFDILPAWAGVKSRAADAALLGWMFLDGGRIAGNQVLERSTVRSMLTMQKSTEGKPLGLGLAWHLGRQGREPFIEHGGGGVGIESLLRLYPRRGLSIAVLGNIEGYGPGLVAEYTAALLAAQK